MVQRSLNREADSLSNKQGGGTAEMARLRLGALAQLFLNSLCHVKEDHSREEKKKGRAE